MFDTKFEQKESNNEKIFQKSHQMKFKLKKNKYHYDSKNHGNEKC